MSLMELEKVKGKKAWCRGRRHLDGSVPGHGQYLQSVSVSLRPEEIAELERLGGGNRSQAVRALLASYRATSVAVDPS